MPTARFYRRADRQWQPPHAGAWSAVAAGTHYSEDDFIHHGIRSRAAIDETLTAQYGASQTSPAPRSTSLPSAPQTRLELSALVGLLNDTSALDKACPMAEAAAGTPAGFDTERACCRHARRRNQSAAPPAGLPGGSQGAAACWERASGSEWVSHMASWAC